MVVFFTIVAVIAVAFTVHSFRRNSAQRETLDSVAAVAGWQSRRPSRFLASVSGSWRGDSVSMWIDHDDEDERTSLRTRIRGQTGARKMVIVPRRRSEWWNPDILPPREVRLSNARMNEELVVQSDDKVLADWLMADEDLARLAVKVVRHQGSIEIGPSAILVVRPLSPPVDLDELTDAANADWDLATRLRKRVAARAPVRMAR